MAVRPFTLSPITLTSGQAQSLGSNTIHCSSIFIQADALNTNKVYWGASNVSTTNGLSLAPNEKTSITLDPTSGNNTFLTLGSIYLDTDTTGNKVRVTYWRIDI